MKISSTSNTYNTHILLSPLQFSTINGVSVHRPLLPLDKAAILDFAHKFGVPYFKVPILLPLSLPLPFLCNYFLCLLASP